MIQNLKIMLKLMVMKKVIDIGLIGTMEEVVLPTKENKAFDELESSMFLWRETLAHLHHTM
jgi:hypothetical protein